MKRAIYLISTLLLMILLVSCGQKTPAIVDKEFKGNPDLDNINDGIMYPIDNDEHFVNKVYFDSANVGGKVCCKDYTFQVICEISDETYQKYGWEDGQIDGTMKSIIIEQNDQYQWDTDDVLCKTHGKYNASPRFHSMIFYFQLDDSMREKPGYYTLIFYNPEGKIDSMYDFRTFSRSDVEQPEEIYKPVIYLYPEEETDVYVTLDFDGEFTCTYPQYDNGWNITAQPDGTLYEADSDRYYNFLFWEGTTDIPDSFDKAIVVSGDETASFLEEYLEAAGLNDSEMDDFITFWLPKMQNNPYNLISFPTEEYEEIAKLNVDPMPDTVIRVYMVYKPLDEYIEIPEEQQLQMPQGVERNGFTVVEWGGSVAE